MERIKKGGIAHRARGKENTDKSRTKGTGRASLKKALKKQAKEISDPPRPTDTLSQSVSAVRPRSGVKEVPNFKQLHKNWEKKMDRARESNRKCTEHHSSFTAVSDKLLPPLTVPSKGSGRLQVVNAQPPDPTSAIFTRLAQSASKAIRAMSRNGTTDQENRDHDGIKLKLEGQFSEVEDKSPCLLQLTQPLAPGSDSLSPHPLKLLASNRSVPRHPDVTMNFYENEPELCALFNSAGRAPYPPIVCSGRKNPVGLLLTQADSNYHFVPIVSCV